MSSPGRLRRVQSPSNAMPLLKSSLYISSRRARPTSKSAVPPQSAHLAAVMPQEAPTLLPLHAPTAGHASTLRTVPFKMSTLLPLARRCGRVGIALPPTTTVSTDTNRLREEASVSRGNCEAAVAGASPRPPQRHGTWLQAPPQRDRTLGRASATPASAGSPTIPRPKSTRTEQGQRHAGTVGYQGGQG